MRPCQSPLVAATSNFAHFNGVLAPFPVFGPHGGHPTTSKGAIVPLRVFPILPRAPVTGIVAGAFLWPTMKFDRIESIVIVGIGIAFVLIALAGLWQLF